MIVPDVNLLVYAYNAGAHQHIAARRWWDALLNGTEPVGLPWAVITGFVRLMTNPRVAAVPLTSEQAMDDVLDWLHHDHVSTLNPGPEHLELLRRNLAVVGAGADWVTDAHIAALAMEHGATVHSNDADFGRFPGLRWRNPL